MNIQRGEEMDSQAQEKKVKKAFWAIAAFYMLIAFEFFYMVSPFAIYFYSVYKPGLNFANEHPWMAWLASFFLPHFTEKTSSTLIDLHTAVGSVLAIVGFVTFCMGAGQVYYYKLARKGAVTGVVYNFIRHPQYASLAVCSFGLLLLWPRYIVLIVYVTMLFAYYFLARAEERECEEKFGQSYVDYKNKTNMFLPFSFPLVDKLPRLPKSGLGRSMSILALYFLTVISSICLARGIQSFALESLYALYSENSAYISMTRMAPDKLEKLVEIALANDEVQARLGDATGSINTKFLNYVLPSERHFGAIAMNPVEGTEGHYFFSWPDYDKNLYKIVFTKADLRTDENVQGKELLRSVVRRTSIVEVWIDLSQNQVTRIQNPPTTTRFGNIPLPIF